MAPQIVIDDPLNQGNNVGKSAFRYPNIKVSDISHSTNIFLFSKSWGSLTTKRSQVASAHAI